MLVLTRKTNQSIMIGDEIEVSVLAVSRDKIRLGITAPRDVPVFRKEVYLSIKDEESVVESPAAKQGARDGGSGSSEEGSGDGEARASGTVAKAADELAKRK
ncbi:MAG: carbon storage regulator CsrA [Solirubrobacterales bacterium]|nr:carbon storage regulator CsrA [Solirubrobacterales bacterium]